MTIPRRNATALASFSLVLLLGDPARAGCTKDTDCKGDRICEQGACKSPEVAAQPPPAEATGFFYCDQFARKHVDGAIETFPIKILQATYGGACNVAPGNFTAIVARECDAKTRCDYLVDNRHGDPASGLKCRRRPINCLAMVGNVTPRERKEHRRCLASRSLPS